MLVFQQCYRHFVYSRNAVSLLSLAPGDKGGGVGGRWRPGGPIGEKARRPVGTTRGDGSPMLLRRGAVPRAQGCSWVLGSTGDRVEGSPRLASAWRNPHSVAGGTGFISSWYIAGRSEHGPRAALLTPAQAPQTVTVGPHAKGDSAPCWRRAGSGPPNATHVLPPGWRLLRRRLPAVWTRSGWASNSASLRLPAGSPQARHCSHAPIQAR